MNIQRSLIIFLTSMTLSLFFPVPSSGQVSNPLSDLKAESTFGESIVFSAEVKPEAELESIELIFKIKTTGKSIFVPTEIGSNTQVIAEYIIQPQDYIPAFSTIEYWFRITFLDGTLSQSETQSFVYQDDRFEWQHLETEDQYEIFWVDGDIPFALTVHDALYESLASYNQYLDLPLPDILSIYIYSTSSALQSALEKTNARWIAGHANSIESIILAAIPEGGERSLDVQRQIPHEITHIRLFLYMDENYGNLPTWYSEGLASLAELQLVSEYWQILQAAWLTDSMIPLSQLCSSIPAETEDAELAYAQSDSFVRYLYSQYGKPGLQDLLDAYRDGHTCSNGLETAFGTDLETLEKRWYQATFNSAFIPKTLNAAITWIILLVVLLVTPAGLILVSMRKKRPKEVEDE